jgi:hypothetical protein
MFWNILQPIIGPIVEKLVDRIPNPNERAKAKEQFEMEPMQACYQRIHATEQNQRNRSCASKCFCCRMAPFYRLAMLGMGGLRTFEKMRGVSRETSPIGSKQD